MNWVGMLVLCVVATLGCIGIDWCVNGRTAAISDQASPSETDATGATARRTGDDRRKR